MEQNKSKVKVVQTKNKIYSACLACGFVPFKSLTLINENASSIQHQVDRYVKSGNLEKYHTKDVWTLFLSSETKNKIISDKEETLYYSNALKQYFQNYSLKDTYRLKENKKKLDESDFEGLKKDEIRELVKKTNDNNKKITSRKLRILRNGEAFLFFFGADFPSLPGDKPSLYDAKVALVDSNETYFKNSTFYSFRELIQQEDKIIKSDINHLNNAITNTKINGIFITPDLNYSVYVTYKDIYQFSKVSEINAKKYISTIIAPSTNKMIEGCILLYHYDAPIKKMILRDLPKTRLLTENLFETYSEENILAIPLSPEGQRFAKMISKKYWRDSLKNLVIDKEWQTKPNSYVTYDGMQIRPNKPIAYHLNFCIPDLGHLKQFINFTEVNSDNKAVYVIHCFDFQADMLRECVKDNIKIHKLNFSEIEPLIK